MDARIFLLFLPLLSACCSGTFVGFSYDSRKNGDPSSVLQTILLLKEYKVHASDIRVLIQDYRMLDSLIKTGVSFDLFLNKSQVENLRGRDLHRSVLKTCSIKSLVIDYGKLVSQIPLIEVSHNLKSFQTTLNRLELGRDVQLTTAISISNFKNLDKKKQEYLQEIMGFFKKSGSYIIVDTIINGEWRKRNQFLRSVIHAAKYAVRLLPCKEIPMVLNIQMSNIPSRKEITEFSEKMMKSMRNLEHNRERIYGLLLDITSMGESRQKEQNWRSEQIFSYSRRELFNKNELNSIKTISRDVNTPVVLPTNPVTTPITVPSPTSVTIPSTNPVVTLPPSTPVTIPNTYPAAPLNTNPLLTPFTPVINPVTTYPTPVTGTSPVPSILGQTWCVAKMGSSDMVLQIALDYACGIGGADCSAIQQTGSCFNPNTMRDHASYAFNSYYQKNPMASSCDFGGTATLVNINPSSGTCIYPSSTSTTSPTTTTPTPVVTNPVYNPGNFPPSITTPIVTNPGNPIYNPGNPVYNPGNPANSAYPGMLNTTNPTGSTSVFGMGPPSSISNSVPDWKNVRSRQVMLILLTAMIELIEGF